MEQLINEFYAATDMQQKLVFFVKALWLLWVFISPYAYAFGTATALLLWRVARRKPDETGSITAFSTKYIVHDRRLYLISTAILIVIAVNLIKVYWPSMQVAVVGILIGAASGQLGVWFEKLGEAVANRGEKEIKKINPDD